MLSIYFWGWISNVWPVGRNYFYKSIMLIQLLITYGCFLCNSDRDKYLWQRPSGLQSLKYLLASLLLTPGVKYYITHITEYSFSSTLENRKYNHLPYKNLGEEKLCLWRMLPGVQYLHLPSFPASRHTLTWRWHDLLQIAILLTTPEQNGWIMLYFVSYSHFCCKMLQGTVLQS